MHGTPKHEANLAGRLLRDPTTVHDCRRHDRFANPTTPTYVTSTAVSLVHKKSDSLSSPSESRGFRPSPTRRAAADVARVIRRRTSIPIQVVQDAAPELRALPEALAHVLLSTTTVRTLIDFEHLTGVYLDAVVDACEPEGDPHNMKSWYRGELLRDDGAIDRIWRSLRERAKRLPGDDTTARKAIAAALSYIRHRKHMMRYASHYAANLTIGSGATEGTCWMMQRRVKRPGQSWQVPGLRGTLATRALVASNRWRSAWPCYAAQHRRAVECVS